MKTLSNVAVWLKENKPTLNLGKSKSMLIGGNQKLAKVSELSISIFNCSLEKWIILIIIWPTDFACCDWSIPGP